MIGPLVGAQRVRVTRIFQVTRERVFRAWTEPKELRQWFGVAEGFTTPIAEVDLRVGGSYRLGMQPPGSDQVLIAQGIYREIVRPEKLVFTWRWETPNSVEPHTLVTIEFFERDHATESHRYLER